MNHMNNLANLDVLWISSCEKTVEESEKQMDQLCSDDTKQCLLIIQSLRSSSSKMLSVDELTEVTRIQSYTPQPRMQTYKDFFCLIYRTQI